MIHIERTTDSGYKADDYELEDAIGILNSELENSRTLWIDGAPFNGEIISKDDLLTCKKNVCVTNKLIGG